VTAFAVSRNRHDKNVRELTIRDARSPLRRDLYSGLNEHWLPFDINLFDISVDGKADFLDPRRGGGITRLTAQRDL
jgi:hypothetical protein